MLKSILVVLILAVSYSATAAPIQLSHQGRLLDASGTPVPNGDYSIIYRLYDAPLAGTLLWEETQIVTVRDGSFSVLLGSVTPLDFAALSATTPGQKYIETAVAGDPPMTPRLLLTDVPRAALARSVQGDITTSPGQLTLSKADAKRALEALSSSSSTSISFVDTSTADTSYFLRSRHDAMMATIQNIRAVGPSGDTSQIQLSVDTGGSDVSLSRVFGPGDAHFGSLRTRSRVGKNSTELYLRAVPMISGDSNIVRVATDTAGSGFDAITAKKVVKFKAGTALANTVNRVSVAGADKGVFLNLTAPVSRGVEINVDSTQASMLFGDTLGDTGIVIATSVTGPRVRVKGTDATGKYEEISLKPERLELTSTDPSSNRIEFTLKPDRIEISRVAPGSTPDTSFSVRTDASGNVGMDMITAKKVAKFKAGAALATAVNKALPVPALREGASISVLGQMLRGIEVGVDSTQATILFGDTLGDTGILITTSAAGPRMGMQETNAAREKLILVVKPDRIEIARSSTGGGLTVTGKTRLEAGRMFMVDTLGDTSVIIRDDGTTSFAGKKGYDYYSSKSGIGIARTITDTTFFVDTSGNAKFSGSVSVGTPERLATLTVGGNICATGTIGACSDSRFKTNVSPITDALSLLTQLQGVRYDWKREEYPDYKFSDKRQIGLIAQEVAKVLPEVVQKNADGYFSIDYGKLTPLLIEALKLEQKATARVAARNELLSQRVDRLEKLVNKMVSAGQKNGTEDLAVTE